MYRAILAVSVLALSACAPTIEQHLAQCQGYGFEPGTAAMASCVQGEQQAYQARLQAGLAAMNYQYQVQQQTQALQAMQRQQQMQSMMPQQVWINRGSGW